MQATGGWWFMYCGQLKCLFLHVFHTHLIRFSSSFFILPLEYLITALSAILLLAPSDTSETTHPVLLSTWQKCDTDLKTIPKLIWPLATPLQECLKNEDSFYCRMVSPRVSHHWGVIKKETHELSKTICSCISFQSFFEWLYGWYNQVVVDPQSKELPLQYLEFANY